MLEVFLSSYEKQHFYFKQGISEKKNEHWLLSIHI